jgi:hypothetical protein
MVVIPWESAYNDRLAELALHSQLWWGAAGLTTLLLLLAAFRGMRSSRARAHESIERLRELRTSDSATASIEFLLVLFPFLVIVLTVWQLAFMFNARLHVGYAGYAAARSASVMIPAELGNESAGQLRGSREASGGKWERIRRAALPGTLTISPGHAATASLVGAAASGKRRLPGNPGGGPQSRVPDPGVLMAVPLFTLHYGTDVLANSTRLQRAAVKAAYADAMTEVLVNGAGDGTPQTISNDTVEVRINYVFWLHVPYVGGLIEALFDRRPTNPRTGKPFFLNPYPTMTIRERIVMTNWRQNCAVQKYCP